MRLACSSAPMKTKIALFAGLSALENTPSTKISKMDGAKIECFDRASIRFAIDASARFEAFQQRKKHSKQNCV